MRVPIIGRLRRGGAAVLFLAACAGDSTAPPPPAGPPYIAIVTLVDAPTGADVGGPYRYVLRGLSSTAPLDTTITAAPTDTIIVSVKPGTYDLALEGLPAKCLTRFGTEQTIVVPEASNTAIARYTVICRPLLRLQVITEGNVLDDRYVYRVTGAGVTRTGTVGALDQVFVEGLPAGDYDVELTNIAANCTPVSAPRAAARVSVASSGNATVAFRIGCSDPGRRPLLHAVTAQWAGDQSIGVTIAGSDPDRDLDRYVLDVTDCAGRSVRAELEPTVQRGLRSDRTAFQDSILVLTALDLLERADAGPGPRCIAARLGDAGGNTTPFAEAVIRSAAPSLAPVVTTFNARYEGTTAIATRLNAVDRQDDFAGVWAQLRLRDGVLGALDGRPDIGFYNVAGFLGTALPNVPLGGRIQFGDVLAVEAFVFDRQGNVALVRDTDFNQ